jgi:hypothetical protein
VSTNRLPALAHLCHLAAVTPPISAPQWRPFATAEGGSFGIGNNGSRSQSEALTAASRRAFTMPMRGALGQPWRGRCRGRQLIMTERQDFLSIRSIAPIR